MAAKPKLIFVDDDANILNAMRRSLFGMQPSWDMAFFTSPIDALKDLDSNPADVVVSDMRMPGVDGAQFLSEIKRRWPQTVRFILSGYSDSEAVLRTIGPSHQYLAKPCDSIVLVDAIKRSLHVRQLLGQNSLVAMAQRLDEVPTLSEHLISLINLINSDTASTRDVAELVARDVTLTARMLKLTNSAYFSLPQQITDPRQAVSLLGFDTIRAVVLVAVMDTKFQPKGRVEQDMERINVRSLEICEMSRMIAKAEGASQAECEEAACIGALMHIGSLALVSQFSEEFAQVVNVLKNKGTDIAEAERTIFGADHAAIGAYILGLWGFNDNIVDAVMHHHRPSQSMLKSPVLLYAHIAQYLGKRIESENPEAAEGLLDQDYVNRQNVRPKLEEWAALCEPILRKS